uniref:Uncharacterized protein n=1 Tax=Tanacetum cinerariifolium TaxID=118510 RepID=A0A6L2NY85_TANCI|nr:hypothetical protein [Tanacetum cinerariifolium]
MNLQIHIAVLARLSGTTVYQNYTKCFMVTMLHESVVLHEIVSESNSSVDVPLQGEMENPCYRKLKQKSTGSLLKTEAEVKDCISRTCSRNNLIEYAEEVSPLCTKVCRDVLCKRFCQPTTYALWRTTTG